MTEVVEPAAKEAQVLDERVHELLGDPGAGDGVEVAEQAELGLERLEEVDVADLADHTAPVVDDENRAGRLAVRLEPLARGVERVERLCEGVMLVDGAVQAERHHQIADPNVVHE